MLVVHIFLCVLVSVAAAPAHRPTAAFESHAMRSPISRHQLSTRFEPGTVIEKLSIRLTTGRKNRFTWKISSYSTLNHVDVDLAFYRATKLWSKVANIEFMKEENEGSSVDIDIKIFWSYDLVCDSSFTDNNIAHMVRKDGVSEIHMKGSAKWNWNMPTVSTRTNGNLVAVAAHQLGHVLGLNHSSNPTSIMYNGDEQNSFLNEDDIRTIQAMYGAKTIPTSTACRYKATASRNGRQMCATVFKQRFCNGPKLDIEHNNVTQQLNADWMYEISSAELYPGCTLRLCRLPSMKGNCTNLHLYGGEQSHSLNQHWLSRHYEQYAASMACTCGDVSDNIWFHKPDQCTSRIEDAFPNGRMICAAVYKEGKCSGAKMTIENGYRKDELEADWDEVISSAQVAPRCTLKLCNRLSQDRCTELSGGLVGSNHRHLPFTYSGVVKSLSCSCRPVAEDEESEEITMAPEVTALQPITSTTTRSSCPTRPSRYMPNGYKKLCAVIYKEPMCGGGNKSLEDGNIESVLSYLSWRREISSVQVNQGCRLKVCKGLYFEAPCLNLAGEMGGTDFADMPAGFDNAVTSLICSCGEEDGEDDGTTRRTPITTTESISGIHASCPADITQYMPDGTTPMCAAVYTEEKCKGRRLPLADSNRTVHLDYDWSELISSAEVNPSCTLMACKAIFPTHCTNLTSAEWGRNFNTMPAGYDNTITSLTCICNGVTGTNISPTTTTTRRPTSDCSSPPPKLTPSGAPLCAIAFKSYECGSVFGRLYVEDGHQPSSMPSGWDNAISSIQINPGCTFEACRYSSFSSCVEWNGGTEGLTIPRLPSFYDDDIMTMGCSCNGLTTTERMITTSTARTNDKCPRKVLPGQEGLCAIAYKDENCNGDKLEIKDGNTTSRLNDEWRNKISSLLIRDGCTLRACYLSMFDDCTIFYSGGHNELPIHYDNNIMSLSCTCNSTTNVSPSTTPSATITLGSTSIAHSTTTTTIQDQESSSTPKPRFFIGQPPPVLIPNTNHPTCAVFTTGLLQQNSQLAWMKKEVVNNTLASLAQGSFIYGIAAPNCNIFYCPGPNFGGICKTLGPGQYTNISNANRFTIGSYICDCQYNR